MRPKTIGRVMGIGVRLASRAVVRGLEGPARTANGATAAAPGLAAGSAVISQGISQGKAAGSLSKGIGGFLRPFGRVGRIVWLEVMGLFFLLPVLAFAPVAWRTRMSWAHGPDHRSFIASTLMGAVFFYLGVSSFWRARRRAKNPH